MKKFIWIITLLLFSLSSCNLENQYDVQYKYEIDQQLLERIESNDNIFCESMSNGDYNEISDILTKSYKDSIYYLNLVLEAYSNNMMSNNYKVFNRYFVEANSRNLSKRIRFLSADEEYIIDYESNANENFISLIKIFSEDTETMLTLIYIEENDEWKIDFFDFGVYSIDNLTAIDLYNMSREHEGEGRKISAIAYANTAVDLLQPSPYIRYVLEDEIRIHRKRLRDQMTETKGYHIELINSDILIHDIKFKVLNDEPILEIKYISGYDLNGDLLEAEINELQDYLVNTFAYLKDDFDAIVYIAYSDEPVNDAINYDNQRIKIYLK